MTAKAKSRYKYTEMKEICGVEVYYNDPTHRYWRLDDGGGRIPLPGVTGFTGNSEDKSHKLVPWATGLCRDYLFGTLRAQGRVTFDDIKYASNLHKIEKDEAANLGKFCHRMAECYIKGEPIPATDDDRCKRGFDAFLAWEREFQPRWVASEALCYSVLYDYAGHPDLLAELDTLGLIDFKFSNALYGPAALQTAAYQHAVEEAWIYEGDSRKIDFRMLLRFDKDTGAYEHRILRDHRADFKAFLGSMDARKRLTQLDWEWNG